MMYGEFYDRTHKEISHEEYYYVEESYYEFDGDKDEFCKQWLKDVQSGKWAMEYRFRKALDEQKAEYERQLVDKETDLEFYRNWTKELRAENKKFENAKRHLRMIMADIS